MSERESHKKIKYPEPFYLKGEGRSSLKIRTTSNDLVGKARKQLGFLQQNPEIAT